MNGRNVHFQDGSAAGMLFRNIRIFDGVSNFLREGSNLMVEGNRISGFLQSGEATPEGFVEIDGQGGVLMPGIINSHYHMIGALDANRLHEFSTMEYRGFLYAKVLEMTLMQGVTSVRDVGGNDWGVVRAANEGLIDSPRIFPSGAMISQTSGHFDFRPKNLSIQRSEHSGGITVVLDGMSYLADGPDAVRRAARECLRQGATQLKIASGGGIISPSDPIRSLQFTAEEVRAAVEVAGNWGTYVASHVYTAEAAIRDIESGVMSLEHANLMTEEAVRLGADKGVWWSPQTVVYLHPPEEWNAMQRQKLAIAVEGLQRTMELFRIYNARVLFGTDCFGNMDVQHLEFRYRSQFFSSHEILRQATSNGGEALRMSGPLYSCEGDLGVIKPGAMADLLIVRNNPLEDVSVLSDYRDQLLLIMKDGRIFKNLL
jgi:imidazolonepropionase-like amidohydrolase